MPQPRYLANLLNVIAETLHPLGGLHEALVSCGLGDDHLVVFPFVPVGFGEVAADLFAKGRQIFLDDFPYGIGVYLIMP